MLQIAQVTNGAGRHIEAYYLACGMNPGVGSASAGKGYWFA